MSSEATVSNPELCTWVGGVDSTIEVVCSGLVWFETKCEDSCFMNPLCHTPRSFQPKIGKCVCQKTEPDIVVPPASTLKFVKGGGIAYACNLPNGTPSGNIALAFRGVVCREQ